MQRKVKYLTCSALLMTALTTVYAADLTKSYEMPDAAKIIEKDLLKAATTYTLPKSCNLNDQESIARGKYIFHNLNGEKAKATPPKGLVKFTEKNGKKEPKQFGNCVACHNIEGAVGGGNIGPDLSNYKTLFVDTQIRDTAFVYQKIADPRIDNPTTHMTVNLTTGLFNEQEICDLTAYVMSKK
ncbi:sulfur oxidation c-type cytochrome SoxX [Sulfurovum sp. zt1-1]|uniref:Sulfur oxidation c-type cytochrome SoxX n=1 Tax=Sulfurovum zhangzhouensis TaxID=3019067 RepID=A0ABT7R2H2_9BACT|nr:sulfur oxidation c-type cytochrome SoxX [Sulfurovum zhangzhouensis]MDM5272736.1 sulfur oxidation c-type cytochrome SoxX [Sulfurovum zhangzhouensis]